MNLAYVRVSSQEQNEARQYEALKHYSIDKWFVEKQSGKNTDRPQLQKMLDYMRENDTIYIKDFSRLCRSVKDLADIIESCQNKGVTLVSLTENFDISTPTGKLMVNLISSINQFEREILLEKQREGIEIAKQQGKYTGRKPKEHENWEVVYGAWKKGEITAVKAANLLSISRGYFYRLVQKEEGTARDSGNVGKGDTENERDENSGNESKADMLSSKGA